MAIGTVTKYNVLEVALMNNATRGWDSITAGSNMFLLVDNTYTPAATHEASDEITGIITAGDGAPINVGTPSIDEATTPGTTYLDSLAADFGSTVTITAKYLVCILPDVAATFVSGNDQLLWYVDLDDTTTSTSKTSTASDFIITPPTNGWIKFT